MRQWITVKVTGGLHLRGPRMWNAPTEQEFQAIFEEVWQLAERAAASNDRQLAPRLFELADEIAAWRNDLRKGGAPQRS